MKTQIALWKQALIIAVLAVAGYAAWHERTRIADLTGISLGETGGGKRHRGHADLRVPVIVEPVKIEKAIDRLQAVGDGLAKQSVTLFPEVSGRVEAIDFTAGTHIKAGAVILKLDDAAEQIAVKLAQTKLTDARRTLDRNLELLPKNAVAEVTVDTSRTAVETADLEVQQAQEALADRTIRAPFDGVLGIPQVEVGDRITNTTAITTLDDRSAIIVAFDIPEIYLKQLAIGHAVTASTAGFGGRAFAGKISQIGSRIDPATRAVRVRATLGNPDDVLREGMSFIVTLTLEGKDYPVIPELALLWQRDGAYVWRVSSGTSEQVKVAVVKRKQGEILVDAPLKAGELVVVEGTQRLRAGREIRFETPVASRDGEERL
jgi:RND family efflux transporter MFP subunit